MSLIVQNYNNSTTDEYGTFLTVDRQMGSGVVDGLLVVANATPNMTAYVQPGSGLIPTGTYPSSYNYRFAIDTALPGASVTVGTAAASPRIDYIVVYVDKTVTGSTANANVNNTNGVLKLADVQGTPAGSPSVPTVSQIQSTIGASNPYIILAQIAVGANVTTITNTNITDLRTFASDRNDAALGQQSYVDSGLIWSATSGLSASMAAGKAYINVGGTMVPASAAAISGYTFTASQDTYVSINVNGVINYSPVANNAASPTLPANSVWLAIVVTNGSAVTSVNIGQIGATAPVVSSRPLAICDTNGQLIYPKAYQRIIGATVLQSQFNTTSSSLIDVPGMFTPVIIKQGQNVACRIYGPGIQSSGAVTINQAIVEDSTQIINGAEFVGAATGQVASALGAIRSPSAGSHSYKVQVAVAGGYTLSYFYGMTLAVELV